ncbi:hypothetical protein QBC47DRAFT_405043 [Echria macrotheca]|uniref:Uncharacterized protein n=1 Tax=Echria macrotheca TaxID=438768 RepID=A0AAJ0F3W8_9PEZI|nr:hypothetical protein QBC47DRAFT_405043 [Echria macrotheca]
MAVFHPVEVFGVAADRDIVIRKSRRGSTSAESIISLDDVVLNESVTKLPWFSMAAPSAWDKAAAPVSPSSSFANLVPEDIFAQLSGVSSLAGCSSNRSSAVDDSPELWESTPLDRFAKTPQRHEQIAISLTEVVAPCSQSYIDYLPCPGSAPGSPAVSIATDYIPPAHIPVAVQPPFMPPPLDVMFAPIPKPPPVLSLQVNMPDMSRTREWLAVVLEADEQLDPTTRQDTPSSVTLSAGAGHTDGDIIEIDKAAMVLQPSVERDDTDDSACEQEQEWLVQDPSILSVQQMSGPPPPDDPVCLVDERTKWLMDEVRRNTRMMRNGPAGGAKRQLKTPRMRQVHESPPFKRARTS